MSKFRDVATWVALGFACWHWPWLIPLLLTIMLGAAAYGNYVGWKRTAAWGEPFNWRVFVGPDTYHDWLAERDYR